MNQSLTNKIVVFHNPHRFICIYRIRKIPPPQGKDETFQPAVPKNGQGTRQNKTTKLMSKLSDIAKIFLEDVVQQ